MLKNSLLHSMKLQQVAAETHWTDRGKILQQAVAVLDFPSAFGFMPWGHHMQIVLVNNDWPRHRGQAHLAGRRFYNATDLNAQALEWCTEQSRHYRKAVGCVPSEEHAAERLPTATELERMRSWRCACARDAVSAPTGSSATRDTLTPRTPHHARLLLPGFFLRFFSFSACHRRSCCLSS